MITMQHTLITIFSALELERIKRLKQGQVLSKDEINTIVDNITKEIPQVLLVDALRKYFEDRAPGHFEKNSDGTDTSYMHYPTDIKAVDKESIRNEIIYKAPGYRACLLGEDINIEKFEETNADLPEDIYTGVLKHLTQDRIFDEWIRHGAGFDCSGKYDSMYSSEETTPKNIGRYIFRKPIKTPDGRIEWDSKEDIVDGSKFRAMVADIEQYGVYVLAAMLNKYYGITTNQKWFDEHIKPSLERDYSQDLADGTYGYMKIRQDLDEKITNHDWSDIEKDNGPIALDSYVELYREVTETMMGIVLSNIQMQQEPVEEFEDPSV